MATKTILFATDFSTASDAALPHAEALAKSSGARLLIVHVEEPPLAYGGGELYYGLPEPSSERILAMLEDVRPKDPAVPFVHRLTMGDPAGEIVRIAAEEAADMIVLGTHGRSGISRMLMGSVAEAVVRRAPCPVLVYRAAAEKLVGRKAEALHL
jgi:nucleotide-binding universal stress UspA family protein